MMFSKLSVAALSLGRMSWPVQAEDKPSIGLYELMTLGKPLEPIVEVTEFEPLTGRVFIEAHPDMKGSVAASVYIPKDETSPCADGQFYGSSGEEGSDEIAFDADAKIPDEVEGKTKNGSLGAITFEINDPMESPFYSGNDDEGVVNMCISAEINGGDDLDNQLISYVDTHLTVQVIHGSIFASYGQNVQLSSLEPGLAEDRIDNSVPVETELVTKKEFEEKESYRVGMDFSIYAYLEQEQKDKGWSIVGFDEINCGGEVLKASGEDPGILTEISTDSSLLHDAPDDEGAYFTSVVLPAFEPMNDGSSEFLCEGRVKLNYHKPGAPLCVDYINNFDIFDTQDPINLNAYEDEDKDGNYQLKNHDTLVRECYEKCLTKHEKDPTTAHHPSSGLVLVSQCPYIDEVHVDVGVFECICSDIETPPDESVLLENCQEPSTVLENCESMSEDPYFAYSGWAIRPRVTCVDWYNNLEYFGNYYVFLDHLDSMDFETVASACYNVCAVKPLPASSSLVLVNQNAFADGRQQCVCTSVPDDTPPMEPEEIENCSLPQEIGPVIDGMEDYFVLRGSDLVDEFERSDVTCFDRGDKKLLTSYYDFRFNGQFLESQTEEVLVEKGDKTTKELTIECLEKCRNNDNLYTPFSSGLVFLEHYLPECAPPEDDQIRCVCSSLPNDFPSFKEETQTFAQCVQEPHGCGSTFIIKSDAAFLQDQPTEGDDTGGDTQPEEKQQEEKTAEVKGVGRRLQDTGAGAAVLPETTAFSATVTVSRTEGDGLDGLWAPAEGIAGRASTVAATAAVAAAFAVAI